MLVEEHGERYPFKLRPDEIVGVEKRRLYAHLGSQARKAGLNDLATRYLDEMCNIPLPQETVRVVTELRVAKIMEGVQQFLRGGADAVYQHWYEQGEFSYLPQGEASSVTIFSTFYADLAKPVLEQTYHQLGLTEARAQAVPEVFEHNVGNDQMYRLKGQGFDLVEQACMYAGTGNTLHELVIDTPEQPPQ